MAQAIPKKKPSRLSDSMVRRFREAGFLLVSTLSLLVLVALFSFNREDPSWSYAGASLKIHNQIGVVGAYLSDILLSLFGIMAYLVPAGLMVLGVRLLIFKNGERGWIEPTVRAIGVVFLIMSAAGLASMYLGLSTFSLPNGPGGLVGYFVEVVILEALNPTGATILLLAILMVSVLLSTGISMIRLFYALMRAGQLGGVHVWEGAKSVGYRVKESMRPKWPLLPSPEVMKKKEAEAVESSFEVKKESPQDFGSFSEDVVEPVMQTIKVNKPKKLKLKIFSGGSSLPSLDLLDEPEVSPYAHLRTQGLESLAKDVEVKLRDFGVVVKVVEILPGPVVTRYELQLAPGIRASKVSSLATDLARSLRVKSVRVVEVIPGKSVIGIELPNSHRDMVRIKEVFASDEYVNQKSFLTLGLGKDISGTPVAVDLAKMPHLLVAGTTGSGKSVGLNSMLLSLLFKSSAEEVRLILIDPKMLELSIYEGIPHLLTPVVTDMNDAANALRWSVAEMERRYQLMAAMGVRNLASFNKKVKDAIKNGSPLLDPLAPPHMADRDELEPLPYIVVVIDELADMMMVVGKKVEQLIARIAQKARAAGIHLILATQRPSVDVLTGLIKANIPTRISFQVSSRIDSRTILDQQGAETLLGHGDMLYLPPGQSIPMRVHGAFVADHEVHQVVEALRAQGEPKYEESVLSTTAEVAPGGGGIFGGDDDGSEQDPLYDQALYIVTKTRKASISSVQRRLKIGYNRAARLIEDMERAGVVSEMSGNGLREVLAPPPYDDGD